MLKLKYSEDNFERKQVLPDTAASSLYKNNKNLGLQPLPGADDLDIINWVESLINESYTDKSSIHGVWWRQLLSYLTLGSTSDDVRLGLDVAEPAGDKNDTIFRPPLLKTRGDFAADWLSHQITKPEPFVQFQNYDLSNTELTEAQRLYERFLMQASRKSNTRQKLNEAFKALNLWGNCVLKCNFNQERMLTESVNIVTEEFDPEDPDAEPSISIDNPHIVDEILDQYADFDHIFLGNYFCDPRPKNGDKNNTTFRGHIERMSREELWDKFGTIPKVAAKLKSIGNNSNETSSFAVARMADAFVNSQYLASEVVGSGANGKHTSREMYSVVYMETRKTETCIINGDIVVYHKIRESKIKRRGAFSYVHLSLPNTGNSLWGVGLGWFLRQLQHETNILASMRMQFLNMFFKPYIEINEASGVDPVEIISNAKFNTIVTKQPGTIQWRLPPTGSENIFQNTEQANISRTRFYASQPDTIDGSSDKTHQTAMGAKMEAGQIPFNVMLSIVRDGVNTLYSKIHETNLAYLQGDLEVTHAGGIDEPSTMASVMTDEHLDLLRENRNSIQLYAGKDLSEDKLTALNQNLQNPLIGELLQGVSSNTKAIIAGQIFAYSGCDDIDKLIKKDLRDQEEAKAQQAAAAPPDLNEMTLDEKGNPVEMPPQEPQVNAMPQGAPQQGIQAAPPPPMQ
jgi:hypothetical protein